MLGIHLTIGKEKTKLQRALEIGSHKGHYDLGGMLSWVCQSYGSEDHNHPYLEVSKEVITMERLMQFPGNVYVVGHSSQHPTYLIRTKGQMQKYLDPDSITYRQLQVFLSEKGVFSQQLWFSTHPSIPTKIFPDMVLFGRGFQIKPDISKIHKLGLETILETISGKSGPKFDDTMIIPANEAIANQTIKHLNSIMYN